LDTPAVAAKSAGYEIDQTLGTIVPVAAVTAVDAVYKSQAVKPYLTAFGVDSWQPGYRLRLDGAYTNKNGNAGAKIRFQSQATTRNFFSIPYAYGWVKFLDNVFTISGGLVDDGTWNSGGAILGNNDPDQGEGLGALVKITPVSGVDVGFGVYAISTLGGGDNQVLARELTNNKIDLDKAKYTFNLAYTLPDVFKVTGTARVNNWTRTDTPDINKPSQTSRAIVAARLLAVKNLNAVVEADFANLNTFGGDGLLTFYETLGYKIEDVGFGLNSVQWTSNVKAQNKSALEINPWVNYSFGSIIPQLDFVYVHGGQSTLNAAASSERTAINTKYNRFTSYEPTWDYKYSVFSVRPSIKFALDGNTFIELGDLVNIEQGKSGTYGHPDKTDKADRVTNVAYVDFKWSF
jgi:hypothetical protein